MRASGRIEHLEPAQDPSGSNGGRIAGCGSGGGMAGILKTSRRPSPAMSFSRVFAAAAVCLAAVGCQSSATDALDIAGAEKAAPRAIVEQEAIGEGPALIAMLLPRSAPGSDGSDAADYRDGAALAVKDLGDGKASILVLDTKGQSSDTNRLAQEAIAKGARVILGPTTASDVAVMASVSPGTRPPVIALVSNAAPKIDNVYDLVSDEIDSAIAGAVYAVAAGNSSFVALAPRGYPAAAIERLSKRLAAHGASLTGTLEYSGSTSNVIAELQPQKAALTGAGAVIVLAGGGDAEAAVTALRSATVLSSGGFLVGTSAWPQSLLSSAVAEKAVVAFPGRASMAEISERFRAEYGRPLTLSAAYGYDAAAIPIGIIRVIGPDGLSAATLTAAKGFRGATGVFRFDAEGRVERLMPVYQVSAGALRPVDGAAAGF